MKAAKKEYNILVIEDNPGDFALVEEFLVEEIQVLTLTHAKCCKEAVSILTINKFDIVLLDLSLPDKTGMPLIEEIVALSLDAPIIVLTGYTEFEFGVKSLSLGISDYLLKEELTPGSLYKSILYSSAQKRIISDLKLSEKKYSELFQLSPQPMWVFDLETLYFLNVNNAAIRQYGYSREEFLSMTIKDIKLRLEVHGIEKEIENCNRENALIFQGNFSHRKKNGELIQVDTKSNFIDYKGKKAVVILAIDVTERLNYIKAIEHQNERLREISWIQSHVVRAPLARIMGLTQIITGLESKDERELALGYLLKSAMELDAVIKEITNKTMVSEDEQFSQINMLLHCEEYAC